MSSLIDMKGVSLTFHKKDMRIDILNEINLSFKKGEFIVIYGPSGTGKSSILNLLAGYLKPSEGSILLDNIDISKFNEKKMCKYRNEKIGFIFQSFNLIYSLNTIENISIPRLISGYKKSEAFENSLNILKDIGLAERKKHYPNELSGGEQQRVAIARAISNNPEIILADEPTGNLDRASGKLVLDLISSIHSKDKIIIMVTHDLEICKLATRTINMDDL